MNNTILEIDGVLVNIEELKHKKGRKSKKDLILLEKIKNKQIELGIYVEEEPKVPKKKGRKPKLKNNDLTVNNIPKKRGRKPKGGKIVSIEEINKNVATFKTNIILHLKCNTKDLLEKNNFIGNLNYIPTVENIEAFNNLDENVAYINNSDSDKDMVLENVSNKTFEINYNEEHHTKNTNKEESTMKEIWEKLKKLQYRLKHNLVSEKKSNCFWCTYEFDNMPIYIPKYYINNNYEVYGNFCSPECACAYLCNEKIDASTRWERYSLLNSVYNSIFNYNNNIKPAPNPHYILDKYYGNMSIEEFRKLTKNNTSILVVDKPLTKVLPEIHNENFEMPNIGMKCNQQINNIQQKKYRLSRNKPALSRNTSTSWLSK